MFLCFLLLFTFHVLDLLSILNLVLCMVWGVGVKICFPDKYSVHPVQFVLRTILPPLHDRGCLCCESRNHTHVGLFLNSVLFHLCILYPCSILYYFNYCSLIFGSRNSLPWYSAWLSGCSCHFSFQMKSSVNTHLRKQTKWTYWNSDVWIDLGRTEIFTV